MHAFWIILKSQDGAAVFSLIGLILTIYGLRQTFLQAKIAKEASVDARDAVSQFRFRMSGYEAYRDLSEAEFAIGACRESLDRAEWNSASSNYEIARRALIRVYQARPDLPDGSIDKLKAIENHIKQFCNKVDAAKSGKGPYPDREKVLAAIRKNYEPLSSIKKLLEREV